MLYELYRDEADRHNHCMAIVIEYHLTLMFLLELRTYTLLFHPLPVRVTQPGRSWTNMRTTWFTVHRCYHISAIVAKYGEILTRLEYGLYNIIQKRDLSICNHLEYRSHSKPAFFNLKTLTIADLVQFKSMVLMYKIYNNLMPSNILSYFWMVHYEPWSWYSSSSSL